jgi:hypothetical protein
MMRYMLCGLFLSLSVAVSGCGSSPEPETIAAVSTDTATSAESETPYCFNAGACVRFAGDCCSQHIGNHCPAAHPNRCCRLGGKSCTTSAECCSYACINHGDYFQCR